MSLKDLLFILIILFLSTTYFTEGQNLTDTNVTSTVIKNEVKSSGSTIRSLFLLFLGCLLTTFLIIAMILTYNRVTSQPSSTNLNLTSRFRNILQSLGLNNFHRHGRFNFFSISNNNHPQQSSGHHRQGETSRTHLNENQDEALLFDDPYADGGISGGINGSSANPYKSLTLSVA